MHKLVVLLSITTALFAGAAAYLYFHHDETPLRPLLETVPAVAPERSRAPTSAPAPAAAAATRVSPAAAPPAVAEMPTANKAPAPRAQPGDLERTFLEREADPVERAQLIEEIKIGLRRDYPGLERVAGLDAAIYETLISLLAEQKVQAHKASIECKFTSTCGMQLPQLRAAQQAELAALLGADGKLQFEQYRDSRSERLRVNSMRGRLTDESRLADSQAEALIAALADERQRAVLRLSGKMPVNTLDGVPFVQTPGMTFDQLMEAGQAYQASLRGRAAELLTPAQLAVYDQMTAEKMVVWRSLAQSTVDDQAQLSH
jgi:hypothetical protein